MTHMDLTTPLTRRSLLGLAGLGALALAGCSAEPRSASATNDDATEADDATADADATADDASAQTDAQIETAASGGDAIVVYFSRAGENYQVGTVEVGNTAIVAQMIAEEAGIESAEIVPAEAYPESYDECTQVAQEERAADARPALSQTPDVSGYQTVYLGYPIWWGDVPMCVMTYLESQAWSGKTVVPFCTHGGSGFGSTKATLGEACEGATLLDGLSLAGTTAQNDRDETRTQARALVAEVG